MTTLARLAGLALLLALAAGCGVEDLPDDETFTACLDSVGLDPEELDGAGERRTAFAEPKALDCVADVTSPSDREAVLGGVFEDDEDLWPVLLDWIATRGEQGREKIAQDAGRLLGGADGDGTDEDDEFEEGWSKEAVNAAVAVAAYDQVEGDLPGYDAWRAEFRPRADPSEPPPYGDYAQYSEWLAEADHDLWLELDDLQDRVREARED